MGKVFVQLDSEICSGKPVENGKMVLQRNMRFLTLLMQMTALDKSLVKMNWLGRCVAMQRIFLSGFVLERVILKGLKWRKKVSFWPIFIICVWRLKCVSVWVACEWKCVQVVWKWWLGDCISVLHLASTWWPANPRISFWTRMFLCFSFFGVFLVFLTTTMAIFTTREFWGTKRFYKGYGSFCPFWATIAAFWAERDPNWEKKKKKTPFVRSFCVRFAFQKQKGASDGGSEDDDKGFAVVAEWFCVFLLL